MKRVARDACQVSLRVKRHVRRDLHAHRYINRVRMAEPRMATNAGILCAVGNARGGVFERQASMAIETPACSGTVVSAIYWRTREKNGKSDQPKKSI